MLPVGSVPGAWTHLRTAHQDDEIVMMLEKWLKATDRVSNLTLVQGDPPRGVLM